MPHPVGMPSKYDQVGFWALTRRVKDHIRLAIDLGITTMQMIPWDVYKRAPNDQWVPVAYNRWKISVSDAAYVAPIGVDTI